MGLARAENLIEATQNADVFVEVSGILRALASNLLKASNDLRLLSSGPNAGLGEIRLPPRQAGSSIMPGKVNPVIPEAVAQAALAVLGQDEALTYACSSGNLELNQFLPLVADCLLTTLDLLRGACRVFVEHCVGGIEADENRCRQYVDGATATATALVDAIGYEAAQSLVSQAKLDNRGMEDLAVERDLLTSEEYGELTSADAVTRLGSREQQRRR
jgi:aspartate ammonia-lyase